MYINSIKKKYTVFIAGLLTLIIVCSIFSGIAFSSQASKNDSETAVISGTSQTDSKPDETDAPTATETTVSPDVPVNNPLSYDVNNSKYVIYLDAGHGWGDNGCSFPGLDVYEKDITLALTKRLREALETMGYTVRMTRENDETCVEPLIDNIYKSTRRIQYANSQGADYFVSIHIDSFESDSSVNGIRIYYVDRFEKSQQLSEKIAGSIADQLHTGTPILKSDQSYNVLVLSAMPSILIEAGFASNPEDAANLTNEEWQTAFAQAVALGINAQVQADAQE